MWLMVFKTTAHKTTILRNTTTNETTIILPASGKYSDERVVEREDSLQWGSRQARTRPSSASVYA
jgi:hypothetical protein